MTTRWSRSKKVRRIFQQFDFSRDGGFNREEMFVVAVNPRVKFSDEQISAILDEVYRTFDDFVSFRRGFHFIGAGKGFIFLKRIRMIQIRYDEGDEGRDYVGCLNLFELINWLKDFLMGL
ncbi:unnamed protein product [Lactuca saligna]|uniref:EF-hand domain-containing protein n=1 Tax=Lactuca saligna TaxID=75948 RepID=A0AA35Z6C4_LACSI|nr:unnamed protein product [Lactuca saligna]